MNNTLEQIRTNALQNSEENVAARLNMTLSDYLEMENKPLKIEFLSKLAKAVCKPIDELLDLQKQEIMFVIDDGRWSIDESVVDYIKDYSAKKEAENRLSLFREILAKREQIKEELLRIEENKPQRIYANGCEEEKILKKIDEVSQKTSIEIADGYNRILSVDNIMQLINENNWKKDEDSKLLGAELLRLLNDLCFSVLCKCFEGLNKEINNFLERFVKSAKQFSAKDEVVNGHSFNYKVAFAGNPTGIIIVDDFPCWATSLGDLEKIIPNAKKGSALKASGIILAAAAAGGVPAPPELMTGLGKWIYDKFLPYKIGKDVVKKPDEERVLDTFISRNKKFWERFKDIFISDSKRLEDNFEDYIYELKEVVFGSDEDIKNKIVSEENKIKAYNSRLSNS